MLRFPPLEFHIDKQRNSASYMAATCKIMSDTM